jgi:hypothetical protein
MFTRKEQRTLTAAASELRRIAGYFDSLAPIPSGAEESVIGILDVAHTSLLEQAERIHVLKESVKARQ